MLRVSLNLSHFYCCVCQRAAGVKGCDCFRVILRNGIKVMENAEVKRMWIVDWFVCAWDISHGALEDSW